MIEKMTNNNTTNFYTKNIILSELITGIILCGIVCQIIIGILIFTILEMRPLYYSIGLWIGIVIAAIMAIHMNSSISKALDFDEESAIKIVRKDSIIRYIVLLIIFGILMVTDMVNPIAAFVGVAMLKFGAYLQPFTHNMLRKIGPSVIKEFIKQDDANRAKMLEEYYEEQKRLEEEKLKENNIKDNLNQENN